MERKLQVIDLACGIGGRSKAFIEEGFEVICAFNNDRECAAAYPKTIENNNFIYRDLKDISPKELPYADIITGKIIVQGFSYTRKKNIEQNDVNNNISNIIHNRCLFYRLRYSRGELPVIFLNCLLKLDRLLKPQL